MLKNILLDAGYTLVYHKSFDWLFPVTFFDYTDKNVFEEISKTDKFKELYAQGYKYLDDNHVLKDETDEYEVFLEFYKILLLPFPELETDSEKIKDITRDMVYDYEKFAIYDDVAAMLAKWKREGYKLGIISDIFPSLRNVFKRLGIYDYFDVFVMSSDHGVFKPHEKMYLAALNPLKANAEECIFVDDSESNLAGAEKMGIRPLWITRENNKLLPEEIPAKTKYPRFLNLEQIDEHITKMKKM